MRYENESEGSEARIVLSYRLSLAHHLLYLSSPSILRFNFTNAFVPYQNEQLQFLD
jgi:hypothetical protein